MASFPLPRVKESMRPQQSRSRRPCPCFPGLELRLAVSPLMSAGLKESFLANSSAFYSAFDHPWLYSRQNPPIPGPGGRADSPSSSSTPSKSIAPTVKGASLLVCRGPLSVRSPFFPWPFHSSLFFFEPTFPRKFSVFRPVSFFFLAVSPPSSRLWVVSISLLLPSLSTSERSCPSFILSSSKFTSSNLYGGFETAGRFSCSFLFFFFCP